MKPKRTISSPKSNPTGSSATSQSNEEKKQGKLSKHASLLSHGLAALGGACSFLGFAGFDLWPLSFVGHAFLLWTLSTLEQRTFRRMFSLGLTFGFVMMAGGYYWLVDMLHVYSGLPKVLNYLIACALYLFMGMQYGFLAWLSGRLMYRGVSPTLALGVAGIAIEFLYPSLFPFYYGVSLHHFPVFLQPADIGGPLLVSFLLYCGNGFVYELARWIAQRKNTPSKPKAPSPSPLEPNALPRFPRFAAILTLLLFSATIGYGTYRLGQLETRMQEAPKKKVGVVQANMGLFQKRQDPLEGHRRYVEMSLELEQKHQPDFFVWPESAYNFLIPEHAKNLKRRILKDLHTPVIFGGLARRQQPEGRGLYNTAFFVDGDGKLLGTYDKIFLLAFGEYMPFGDWFPQLYTYSPNTGQFDRGSHTHAFLFGDFKISALICYEDILPSFVRKVVNDNNSHLLVNLTNDAWFGDTEEPWIHLALSKLRAVEHHRDLIRSTNSGVSAVINAKGEVVAHTQVFTQESFVTEVHMLSGTTLYGRFGDWIGWLGLFVMLWGGFVYRRKTNLSSEKTMNSK